MIELRAVELRNQLTGYPPAYSLADAHDTKRIWIEDGCVWVDCARFQTPAGYPVSDIAAAWRYHPNSQL